MCLSPTPQNRKDRNECNQTRAFGLDTPRKEGRKALFGKELPDQG